MRKHNYFHTGISVLLILSSILSGCGIKNSVDEPESEINEQTVSQQTLNPTISIDYQADPEDFSLILKDGDNQIAVSGQSPKRTVSDFRESDMETFWRYPEEHMVTGKLPIKTEELEGIDLEELTSSILECIDNETLGNIIEVSSSDGTTVRIFIG